MALFYIARQSGGRGNVEPYNNPLQADPESYVQLEVIGPTTLILIERSVANLSGQLKRRR